MTTFFIIRSGWNAANQSSVGTRSNPKNQFESNQYKLVLIVDAESAEEACRQFCGTCYNNQHVFATSSPRKIKGLTSAIRNYEGSTSVC